jgi:CO/xanthine dehydrogenase Mo-binding subunit
MALSRRRFLKGLGWTSAGLVMVGGLSYAYPQFPALPYRGAPNASDAAAWLRLTPDGIIEVVIPRAEIGQGIAVSLCQIVAEETGFPLKRIRAIHPRTDLLPPARATVGSDSIKDFGPLLAFAAAALGALLKREGVVDGAPPVGGWAKIAARPRLIDAQAVEGASPVSFRAGAVRRIVGTSQPTDQIRAIVTGEAPLYVDDIRLPGMAFATALRAPWLGARLQDADDAAARKLTGYLGLHRVGERAFIAAETRGALERAAAAITPKWTGSAVADIAVSEAVDIDRGLSSGPLEHVIQKAEFEADGRFDLDLRLDVCMAAHAPMEPRAAVAQFDADGKLEVWTGSQDVTFVRRVLAKALGLAEAGITVIGCRVGGGFGGKTICAVELEAALMARMLRRPTKVQWSRLDEFREAFHRPPSSHRIRARLTPDGKLDAWHHAFRSGHVIFTSSAMGPVLQFATSFVGDPGVLRGAISPYPSTKSRLEFEDVRLPVDTGPWRGLGAAPNVWAIETAIDQLARQHSEDPVMLRKRLIGPQWPRLVRTLDRVATLANWSSLRSTTERGYGVACGIYKEMSYAAVIAEVTREAGRVRVTGLWCAHDCGQMVNPDQVKAQIEGNLVWSIGMALGEELTLSGGHIAQSNFADYATPRFSDVPKMQIDMVDAGDAPSGAGETAIIAGTAAITNAIAAMTGKPVTRLPYKNA